MKQTIIFILSLLATFESPAQQFSDIKSCNVSARQYMNIKGLVSSVISKTYKRTIVDNKSWRKPEEKNLKKTLTIHFDKAGNVTSYETIAMPDRLHSKMVVKTYYQYTDLNSYSFLTIVNDTPATITIVDCSHPFEELYKVYEYNGKDTVFISANRTIYDKDYSILKFVEYDEHNDEIAITECMYSADKTSMTTIGSANGKRKIFKQYHTILKNDEHGNTLIKTIDTDNTDPELIIYSYEYY